MAAPTDTRESLVDIIRHLKDDGISLFRKEVALAKREMTDKVSYLGKNSAYLAVAALVAGFAAFFLLLACNNLLEAGLARIFSAGTAGWLAPFLVGMLIGISALLLALKAMRTIRKGRPLPERTLETLRTEKDWIRGKRR